LAREVGRLGSPSTPWRPLYRDGDDAALQDDDRARIMARAALRRLAEPADVANAVSYLLPTMRATSRERADGRRGATA